MGNVRIGPIVLMISMMGMGIFVVMTILTGTGNVLGATYRFAWVPALLIGCVAPRAAIYVLVLLAAYLDLFKKGLVVGGMMDFRDVFFVLAIPPIMLGGMVIHYIASFCLRIRPMTKRDSVLLSIATGLVLATSLIAIAKLGLNLVVLKPLANTSAYYGLIFVLPLALPTVAHIQKYLRFIIIVMVPAAFHALWHVFFGLFEFEHAYMESGFSINLKYMLWGEGIFGPFSAQGSLATTMALCAAICFAPFLFRGKVQKKFRLLPGFWSALLFALFTTAAVLSLKRGPLLIIPGVMVGLFVLRSRILTMATYGAGISFLVLLVVMGEEFAFKLEAWQTVIYDIFGQKGTGADLFRVRTFHARFIDFSMLTEGENWTPFGVEKDAIEGGYFAHSLVVRFILSYGYVPIAACLAVVIPLLAFLHLRLIKMSAGKNFEVFQLRVMAAIVCSFLAASALGVLSMGAYPNPFFFGVFLGILAAGLTRVPESEPDPSLAQGREQPPVLGPGGVQTSTG